MPENRSQGPIPPLLLFFAFLAYIASIFILLQPPEELIVAQHSAMVSVGKPVNEFDNLIARIKKDIGQDNIEIKVLVGPYFRYFGFIGYLYDEFSPTYFILVDEDFYNELTPEEREALAAHESGHILHRYPRDGSRAAVTEFQVLTDEFGAKFVHPDHLKSLLKKANSDYFIRVSHLDKLAQGK